MPHLMDTQLVLLSAALRCAHGVIPIGERLGGKAEGRIGRTLIARGLAQEQIVFPPLKGWRVDADGQDLGLVITPAGLQAIGVGEGSVSGSAGAGTTNIDPEAGELGKDRQQAAGPSKSGSSRPGTHKAHVLALLSRLEGAAMADITDATGWRPHTVRAFLTGLRKAGLPVQTLRESGCVTRYSWRMLLREKRHDPSSIICLRTHADNRA